MSAVTHLRRRGRVPLRKTPWRGEWKLSTEELALRIAAAPSRQGNERGPRPRSDYANNVANLYEKVWNHVNAEHSATFRTTWEQLAVSLAMENPEHAQKTIRRWFNIIAEIGLLEFGEETDEFGRSLCLRVTVLKPPGLDSRSSVHWSDAPLRARRRSESHAQRVARRTAPYRRRSGRGTVPRFDFFWGLNANPVVLGRPSGTTSPRGGQASGDTCAAPGSSRAGNGVSDAIEAGSQRAETAGPRSGVEVANGRHREEGDRSGPRGEAVLATHEAVERRWAAWVAAIGSRLAELAAVRGPGYADLEEAFALCWGGTPDADPWAECRHARLRTRLALEREAARYDRYAGRLAADGAVLRHRTAMALLIEAYARGGCVSPGAPLSRLGKAARQLRRDWHERHPDVKLRRRRERVIRQALDRDRRPWQIEPRRPAHVEDAGPEQWRRWSEWQQGEDWRRGLLERPEADGC